MKKKNLYLIFSIISIICLLSLAATCNMCGHTITNETEEMLEEQTEEESASQADETQSGGSQRETQTEEESGNEEVTDSDAEVTDSGADAEVNHNPIITTVAADEVELDLSDEFSIFAEDNANFLVLAEDEDGDELSYSASDSNENNMAIENIDNNAAGFGWVAPSDPGSYEIYIEVSDGNGGEATVTVSVTVEPAGAVGTSLSTRGFGANAALSGQVNEDGEFFIAADSSGVPYIYVGDTASRLKVQGFLSFDVSIIAGENVTAAWLTIRGSRDGDPTLLLMPLAISSTNYGNSLDGADYGVSSTNLISFYPLSGTDFSFTNENLKNAVQGVLTAGRQYFQVKLVINSANGNTVADGFTILLSDVMLEVEYTD